MTPNRLPTPEAYATWHVPKPSTTFKTEQADAETAVVFQIVDAIGKRMMGPDGVLEGVVSVRFPEKYRQFDHGISQHELSRRVFDFVQLSGWDMSSSWIEDEKIPTRRISFRYRVFKHFPRECRDD